VSHQYFKYLTNVSKVRALPVLAYHLFPAAFHKLQSEGLLHMLLQFHSCDGLPNSQVSFCMQKFDEAALSFQLKMIERGGLGDETYLPMCTLLPLRACPC
jgi:FAE1/Type III polyketide synthase-like protein